MVDLLTIFSHGEEPVDPDKIPDFHYELSVKVAHHPIDISGISKTLAIMSTDDRYKRPENKCTLDVNIFIYLSVY